MYEDDGGRKFYINDSNFLDKISASEEFIQHKNKYLENHKLKTQLFKEKVRQNM